MGHLSLILSCSLLGRATSARSDLLLDSIVYYQCLIIATVDRLLKGCSLEPALPIFSAEKKNDSQPEAFLDEETWTFVWRRLLFLFAAEKCDGVTQSFGGSIWPRDLCQDLRGGGPLTLNTIMELFLISRKNKCTSMREMSNKTTLTEWLYTQNSLWIGASNPKSRGAMQTSATKCSSPPLTI